MKTSLLAALAKNEGSIIAVEKSSKRCDTLRSMLEGLGVTNVTVMNQDFTNLVPSDHPEVEYILVDPSCSGSGMYSRVEVHYGPNSNNTRDRLKALAFYQRKLLVHAMKFPNVKRIVYSTCSINSEENEDVIAAALEWGDGYSTTHGDDQIDDAAETRDSVDSSHSKFRVKRALPSWSHRSENPNYEWSELCVKCDYDNDLTDGFFVAVLEKVKER
jgi:putative methyltransferase